MLATNTTEFDKAVDDFEEAVSQVADFPRIGLFKTLHELTEMIYGLKKHWRADDALQMLAGVDNDDAVQINDITTETVIYVEKVAIKTTIRFSENFVRKLNMYPEVKAMLLRIVAGGRIPFIGSNTKKQQGLKFADGKYKLNRQGDLGQVRLMSTHDSDAHGRGINVLFDDIVNHNQQDRILGR